VSGKTVNSGKIYIARHGQTDANSKHIIISRTDTPLNEVGTKQAQGLAEKMLPIKLSAVFSSHLKRAFKTAEIVAKSQNVPHIIDERIMERDWGVLENKCYMAPELRTTIESFYNAHDELKIENADSIAAVKSRIHTFLDDVTKKYRGKNILIVSHSGVMGFFKDYFEPIEDGSMFVWVENCELWEYVNGN